MSSRILSVALAACFALVGLAPAQICLTGSTGPDLVVWKIPSLSNYQVNGEYDALSLGTTACNVGTSRATWYADDNRHPVISQNLFRLRTEDGISRFEHVGRSWLKHGFLSTNSNGCCGGCVPTFGHFLEPKCSDAYSANRNGVQNFLGPRYPINPHTGHFTYPAMAPSWSGNLRRLEVHVSDLYPTNSTPTSYFGEGHYVSADDALAGNGNNNASYRQVSAFRLGTNWLFGFLGSTEQGKPAIRAWKAREPMVREVDIQLPGEGLLVLAHKVTSVGSGWWNYEYALYNMNSDDGVRSFTLPIPDGVRTRNVGFHDLAYRGGDGKNGTNVDTTDWPAVRSTGELEWQTETFAANDNANALRWGALMNFRFEADAPPAPGDLQLETYKSGQTHTVMAEVPADVPGIAFCDGSQTPCPQGMGCGSGGADRGCLNSSGTGAWLRATGSLQSGAMVLWGTGMPTRTMAVVLRSTQQAGGGSGVAFGDGLLCVGSPKDRIAAGPTVSGNAGFPIQHTGGAGTYHYQLLFRNQKAFCTPALFNLSNGYSVTYP
jgi:hypothetical protein